MSDEVKQTTGSETPTGAGVIERKRVAECLSTAFFDFFEHVCSTMAFWMRYNHIVYDDGTYNLLAMFLEDYPALAEGLAGLLPFAGLGTRIIGSETLEYATMKMLFVCTNKLWTLSDQQKALKEKQKALIGAGDTAAADALNASIKDGDALMARIYNKRQKLLDDIARIDHVNVDFDEEALMRMMSNIRNLAFTMMDWLHELEYEDEDGSVRTAWDLFLDTYPVYVEWEDWAFSDD